MPKPNQINYFVRAANELGITITQVPHTPIYNFHYKDQTISFNGVVCSRVGVIGYIAAAQKQIAKNFFQVADISTPRWVEFYADSTTEDIIKYSSTLTFPVVVKPATGTHGDGIEIGLKTPEDVVTVVQHLQVSHPLVVVEEMFEGTELRLLATRTQFLAAGHRRPASVQADGEHTIAELVDLKNKRLNRSEDNAVLRLLKIDNQAIEILREQLFTPSDVPDAGHRIYLRKVSNLGAGGDSIDVTNEIHPSIKELAIRCVNAVPELPFAGIDFMTKDYTAEQTPDMYTIVEINASPALNMHYYPYKGNSYDPAKEILQELFSISN